MTDDLLCTRCQSPLPNDAKFCPRCGAPVETSRRLSQDDKRTIICPSCGIVNPMKNGFCVGCGSELHSAPDSSESRGSVPETSRKEKKNKPGKSNLTTIVVAVFVVVAVASVIFESRNAPVSDVQINSMEGQTDERVNGAVMQEISTLEKTVTEDPGNSTALLKLANRLHDAKFFPRAIEMYKKYIALKPQEADPRVDLGICYYEMGDTKLAVTEIKSALVINPKHQMAMFNLGVVYLSSNDVVEAKSWFKKCSDLDSSTAAGKKALELIHNH